MSRKQDTYDMTTFSLRIKGFTPETLPLSRMGEYVSALAELIGDDVQVCFERVTKGSAQLNVKISDDDADKAISRIRLAPCAEESSVPRKGYDKIQALLSDDKTSAEFRQQKGAVILKFPGAPKNILRLAIVKEAGEINGRIIKVGGRDDTIPIALRTPEGVIVNCTASVEMARQLKKYLLEPIDVILLGEGKWRRTDKGSWETVDFKIIDVSEMDLNNFDNDLERVRSSGSGWDTTEDVTGELERLRYGS
jgi:hypothetical protein